MFSSGLTSQNPPLKPLIKDWQITSRTCFSIYMHPKLISFLAGFPELSKAEVEAIAEYIPVKEFPKGHILQREGGIPEACYFVLEGCVRQYRLVEGVEKTTAIYTEQKGAISSADYSLKRPAQDYLICEEDCVLICGNPHVDAVNYARFPILKALTAQMLEEGLNEMRENFTEFVISSPEQRYLNLLAEQPDLLQRVPMRHIASLLGMTPESLSRIRRRILAKDA